jgi:dihydroorotate dehydrogenase
MGEPRAIDLGTTLAGVRLPFCAMNAAGVRASTAGELRALAASSTGAIVVRTATVHPFVHPAYRSLHNPGFDRIVPLVRELAGSAGPPVFASLAGATPEEYVTLARAFADAGAALLELNLADAYVAATLAPFEEPEALRALLRVVAAVSSVPLAVKLPERPSLPYRTIGLLLGEAGVRVAVARSDFAGFEKLLVETGRALEVVPVGAFGSGYDVSRALAKGARAVQIEAPLASEGPGLFARLEREMRIARAGRS